MYELCTLHNTLCKIYIRVMNRLCTDYVLGENPCVSSCCASVFPYFFYDYEFYWVYYVWVMC